MWDDRYSDKEYAYGKIANDFLQQTSSRIPAGRVLCLAEGEGRNAVFLAQQGYDVVAVDSSAVGLEKARLLATEMGVVIETIHADLADFDIGENRWQAIVSIFCHVPPAIRKKIHKSIFKGLVDNGVFILEAYTPDQIELGTGGPKDSALTMTRDILQKECTDLTIEYINEIERDINEGKYHTGKGAVVQLFAVKK
ncbi:MAG: methyltransferase domain-containing protein [Gammaproteobacteria bacterium]|nr:methyltransferase domain-containing protein [Gammaproteobacteria bacterium]